MKFHCRKILLLTIGIFLTFIYGTLFIICPMLISIDFKLTAFTWETDDIWRHIPFLQIISTIFILASMIIGLFLFTIYSNSKNCQFLFIFVELSSLIISLITSLIILVGATINRNNLAFSCRKDYKGIFKNYQILDEFFSSVDQILCSESCPCPIMYNYSAVDSFTTNQKYLNDWNFWVFEEYNEENDDVINPFSFRECNDSSKKIVLSKLLEKFPEQKLIDTEEKLNKFGDFWNYVENKFDCTGWCKMDYVVPGKTGEDQRNIGKYLFSDINKGLATNKGCKRKMSEWYVNTLVTFGCTLLTIFIFQLLDLMVGFMLICNCHKDGFNYEILAKSKDEVKNNKNDNLNNNIILEDEGLKKASVPLIIKNENENENENENKGSKKKKKKNKGSRKKENEIDNKEERMSELQTY